jgi:hypothetical protein
VANRPLPYPLQNQVSLSAITDGDASFNALPVFPDDMDEKTFVMLHISANEFRRIASSIDIGSDIGYPDDSVGIWYAWVRSVMSDSPCEIISNCILNNDATRDAVADVFLNNNTTQYYNRLLAKLREDMETVIIGTVGPDCNDSLWGAIRTFVDIICDNATDFFEETEASAPSQILELIDVLANLPILDEIGIDALVDFVNWIVDQFAVYYAGSLTDEYKDALACEIFCIVKDTCSITLDDCYNVLKDRVNPSFSIETLVDVMSNIADILITGSSDFVVDLWLFAMFRFAELGNIVFRATGLFNGADATIRLQQQLRLGFNNPDADWELLCDDCNEVTISVGFLGSYLKDTVTDEVLLATKLFPDDSWFIFEAVVGREYEAKPFVYPDTSLVSQAKEPIDGAFGATFTATWVSGTVTTPNYFTSPTSGALALSEDTPTECVRTNLFTPVDTTIRIVWS